MTQCDVAIIGAGPYGLSIAAHLKAHKVNFRIFGTPMSFWREHMPKGMHLKSEGFASSLYDPESAFTLETYCKEKNIPYADIGSPVPLEVFTNYGLEFQRRFVPEVENKFANFIQRTPDGFRVRLEDGQTISARRIVLAVGLSHFEYVPPVLAALPEEFVTHSSKHHALEQFQGREIAIVGAGASALDLAALLHQAGAHVQVIARRSVIRFHDPPDKREKSLLSRLRNPVTGIGHGWNVFWCCHAPLLFRQMPQEFRFEKVRQILGPAPCWFTKEQVVGKVGLNVGVTLNGANVQNGRVALQLTDSTGAQKTLMADHVISATGYKVDLRRLAFLEPGLRSEIKSAENTPVLSSNFETTVPGLYFAGVTSANTFGPLVRFAFGAGFTSKRLSKHLANTADRKESFTEPVPNVESADRGEMAVR
jgi:thioredoxin reductase